MEASSLLQVMVGNWDETSPLGWERGSLEPTLGFCPLVQGSRVLPAGLTRSLYSARLRMTAVICWSMKMRIDSSRAGRAAATLSHQGLVPKGDTSQSRPGSVGWGRTFRGHIGEDLRRAPPLYTPALAFFHNFPYHCPSPPRPWMLYGSSVCACTAGSMHPSILKEGRKRGTS